MSTAERFQEIFLCPEHNSVPAGVRIGPVLFAAALADVDPCTSQLRSSDLMGQLKGAFENAGRFLEAAGASWKDVARATVFMHDLSERLLLNDVWSAIYPDPDDRPPHKYVPSALPDGVLAAVQIVALPGAPRRVLEVEGIKHNDPMSMGALTGNLVTSSRVITGRRVDDLDEHTALVFKNVVTLIENAGGSAANITQVTAFVGGDEYRESVEKEWRRIVGDRPEPKLHVLEVNLGGGGAPRLEVMGLL